MSAPEEPSLPDEGRRFTDLLTTAKAVKLKATESSAEFCFTLDDDNTYLAVFLRDPDTPKNPLPSQGVTQYFLSILRSCVFSYKESDAMYLAKGHGWKIAAERLEPEAETFHNDVVLKALRDYAGDYSKLFSPN